jgi:RNA polymerase sigma-70 factor, ECF subfamily
MTAVDTAATVSAASRVSVLFETEAVGLLGYFLRRVDDRDDAADLVGETALTLWRRADSIPADPQQARMWMYGVARRTLATHRRGQGRRLALTERLREELAVDIPTPDPRVDDVRAAVRALPPRERELIGLVHWEGFTVTQAAAIMGTRAGAAQMRYQRARARLRAALGDAL